MKKFLVVLSVLALLLIAGPVQANWVNDLPLPSIEKIALISVDFSSSNGIVIVKTKDGSCMKYKIVDEEIVSTKKCGDTDWKDFVKE
jgi:hypothetical protein